jgi:hypothetical protein
LGLGIVSANAIPFVWLRKKDPHGEFRAALQADAACMVERPSLTRTIARRNRTPVQLQWRSPTFGTKVPAIPIEISSRNCLFRSSNFVQYWPSFKSRSALPRDGMRAINSMQRAALPSRINF